jgi:hypothetical protein
MLFGYSVVLWGEVATADPLKASRAESFAAEWKLLLFAVWLHRGDYATSTVMNYVGAVKAWHRTAIGVPLDALGFRFYRLPLVFRTVRKRKPAKQRTKIPWEMAYFEAILKAWPQASVGYFGDGELGFQQAVTWTMMCVAFEQLMRLSELVTTTPPSVSQRRPLKWADVAFFNATGGQLEYDSAGRPLGDPTYATMREPPSKTRAGGEDMFLPFPAGWRAGRCHTAAGPALFRMQRRFPVERASAASVPLFGLLQWQKARPHVVQVSQQRFTTVMRTLCRLPSPQIKYAGLGIHCFRVGGCNRLMDLGASAPQICAAGRWAGDCWMLYARRQRKVIMQLTAQMSACSGCP